MGIIVKEEKS